jgi:hypothetical protein
MTLDEYKALVEAQRKESLAQALSNQMSQTHTLI